MNNTNSHPCHGYDAACGDVCIKIETRSNQSNKSFDDIISWILFHPDDALHERIKHIAEKYGHTVDEVVDHIIMHHEDWVED